MSLFHRNKRTTQPSALRIGVQSLLSGHLKKIGTRLAAYLSYHERRMSLARKKMWAAVFCLAMGLLSMTYLYQGLFVYETRPPTFLSKPGIVMPVLPHLPDSVMVRSKRFHRSPGDSSTPSFTP